MSAPNSRFFVSEWLYGNTDTWYIDDEAARTPTLYRPVFNMVRP